MVKTTIITATFNQLELSQAYWKSLQQNPPETPWEIIWVDDCSSDGTRDWLEANKTDNFRVVLNSQNQGYAANNNLGAKMARGSILCLLNNDTVLTPNWFPPMLEAVNHPPQAGVVGNVQTQVDSGLIDHAGMGFNLIGDTIHPHKGLNRSKLYGTGAHYNAVTAACWLIQKDTFLSLGGFDTAYRNGYEDVDFCLKAGSKGLKHWVCYNSCIGHHVSASRGKSPRLDPNRALFLKRWSHLTRELGETDWPTYYLKHLLRHPDQFNPVKATDALLRRVRLRSGDSKWAKRLRDSIIQPSDQNTCV